MGTKVSHQTISVVSFLVIVAAAIMLLRCGQPAEDATVKAPEQATVAPLQELHEKAKEGYFGGVQVPAQPEVAQPASEPAKVTPPVVVKKPAKQAAKNGMSKAEEAAWVKGYLSAARAQCLRVIVNRKIDYDVQVHEINDFGDPRESPICKDADVLTQFVRAGIAAGVLVRPE